MANRAWSLRRGGLAAAGRPADAPLGRVADDLRLVGQRDHVVQDHGHVAAQGLLDGHGPLRRDRQQPAVDVRAEDGLLLGDLADGREAEELEAAAIGQDRAVPAHEAVQAAQVADHLLARPQGQVIGVGQHHLGPGLAELLDFQSLDARLGGHGHEGGHFHRCRGASRTSPRRAAEPASQCSTRKEKGAVATAIDSPLPLGEDRGVTVSPLTRESADKALLPSSLGDDHCGATAHNSNS